MTGISHIRARSSTAWPGVCWGVLVVRLLLTGGATAQAVELDTRFAPSFTVTAPTHLSAVEPAGAGKLYVAGQFQVYDGLPRNGVARLLPDGRIDATFDPLPTIAGEALGLAVQPDGRVLVGGRFGGCGAVAASGLVRFHPDGRGDTTFQPRFASVEAVRVVRVTDAGMIVVGGDFRLDGAAPMRGVARLGLDGTRDAAFDAGMGIEDPVGWVEDVTVRTDGRLLVGGVFTKFSGVHRSGLVQLEADGSVDESFAPDLVWGEGLAQVAVVREDHAGRILIAGRFDSVNGVPRAGIARLRSDGSVDRDFDPGLGVGGGAAQVLGAVFLGQHRILIAGDFTSYDGHPAAGIARLRSQGDLDFSWAHPPSLGGGQGGPPRPKALAVLADGGVIVAGRFESVDGVRRQHLARLMADGRLDRSYSDEGLLIEAAGVVKVIEPDADAGWMVGGQFDRVNGRPRQSLVRLRADGTVDPGFDAALPPDAVVNTVLGLPDRRLLIGGVFQSVGQVARQNLARLETDGRLDPAFEPHSGPDGPVHYLVRQASGLVVAGGQFWVVNDQWRGRLVRLREDGSSDESFTARVSYRANPDTPARVNAIVVQPDQRLVIGGFFDSVNEQPRVNVARLLPTGELDPEFNPGLKVGGNPVEVHSLALEADGSILLGGTFEFVDGLARSGIARLDSKGVVDRRFNPGSGVAGGDRPTVHVVRGQSDGKLLIAGGFTEFNGLLQANLARLLTDGGLDTAFASGRPPDSGVRSLLIQSDGSVLFGGAFTCVEGQPRQALARYQARPGIEGRLRIERDGDGTKIHWTVDGRLREAENLSGPWAAVPDARSPYPVPLREGMRYYRLSD